MENATSNRRSWNTPTREPWNPVIKHCLNAIDNHTRIYIETGDSWHFDQAETLRAYVSDLKGWILQQEGKT